MYMSIYMYIYIFVGTLQASIAAGGRSIESYEVKVMKSLQECLEKDAEDSPISKQPKAAKVVLSEEERQAKKERHNSYMRMTRAYERDLIAASYSSLDLY